MVDSGNGTVFKYRTFDARTLAIFINCELFFAKPAMLNDPHDCQISVPAAISEAVDLAQKDRRSKFNDEKIDLLEELLDSLEIIERRLESSGVYSLSRNCKNVLMWTHYADQHRGLCIGFKFGNEFLANKKIIGAADCSYVRKNPFVKIILDLGVTEPLMGPVQLQAEIIAQGLVAKHVCWRYEKEVRILRRESGKERFSPTEVKEIVFGLKMDSSDKKTIMVLLSDPKWAHVRFSEMTKKSGSFGLKKVRLTQKEIAAMRQ